MIIRNVEERDFKSCIELFKVDELKCADKEYFKKEWLYEYVDTGLFFVAEKNGQIVGAILGEAVKVKGAILWMFAVKQDLRKKGIGTQLLKTFEEACKERRLEWIMLYSVNENNVIKFYKNRNFNIGDVFVECKKIL